jgi:hypothetical protein
MDSIHAPAAPTRLDSRCYRLTPKGRACVDFADSGGQTMGSLSRYLQDVLTMCGSGIWFQQLQQFMPLRSLEQSLQTLLALGLIDVVAPDEAPPYVPPRKTRPSSGFGQLGRY